MRYMLGASDACVAAEACFLGVALACEVPCWVRADQPSFGLQVLADAADACGQASYPQAGCRVGRRGVCSCHWIKHHCGAWQELANDLIFQHGTHGDLSECVDMLHSVNV